MSKELIVKNYGLEKKSRIAGVAVVSALSLGIIGMVVASWWPIVFLMAPALAASFSILTSGIASAAKGTFFRDVVVERDEEGRLKQERKLYQALYARSQENWNNLAPSISRFDIAKAVVTRKPLTVVFSEKKTDAFGGKIQGQAVIEGFTLTVREKNCPSDIQMWGEAFDNAHRLI